MIVCPLLDPVVVAYLLHVSCLHWLPIFVFAYWLPGALLKALLSQVEEKLSFEVLAYRGPLNNNGICFEGGPFSWGPLHPFKKSSVSSEPPNAPLL